MAKQPQTGEVGPGRGVGMGADQGIDLQPPKPSGVAAAAAGSVGPGALAASEAGDERGPSAGAGLTAEDVEVVRGLARRAGGVDALIRWLEQHRDVG